MNRPVIDLRPYLASSSLHQAIANCFADSHVGELCFVPDKYRHRRKDPHFLIGSGWHRLNGTSWQMDKLDLVHKEIETFIKKIGKTMVSTDRFYSYMQPPHTYICNLASNVMEVLERDPRFAAPADLLQKWITR